jgi:hypothetical protein
MSSVARIRPSWWIAIPPITTERAPRSFNARQASFCRQQPSFRLSRGKSYHRRFCAATAVHLEVVGDYAEFNRRAS